MNVSLQNDGGKNAIFWPVIFLRKKYLEAIKIIEGHCLSSGEGYVHAEWMIGWLQLKFLKQPEKKPMNVLRKYTLFFGPQSKSRFAF